MPSSLLKRLTDTISPLPTPEEVAAESLHITQLRLLEAQADLEEADARVTKLSRRIARLETYLDRVAKELR